LFHCTIGNDYVVLQQSEARALVADITNDPIAALAYNSSDRQVRREHERALIRHLRLLSRSDPDTFRRRYVFRSEWGPESVVTLLALLDGHRRLAKYIDCDEIDRWGTFSADPAIQADYRPPPSLHLLLLSQSGLLHRRRKVLADIEVRVRDLEHVFGTTQGVVAMTRFAKLTFALDGFSSERRIRNRRSESGQRDLF
jgi:hypothetical protein